MGLHIKIRIPVYKKDKWERLNKQGKIEVSSDADTLSEGYTALKEEIDRLLSELDASVRLADSLTELEDEIQQKTYTLKSLTNDINRAARHYESLTLFLKQFGVDPQANRLTFDERLLLESSSAAEVEVLPPDLEV